MSHVFPRHALANPPIAASGDGCYIIDTEGKRYLDACGGAAVSCLGHSDPDVVAAIKAQADAIPYAHTGFFSSQTSIDLAELLIANAPGDIDKVYFVAGGSEAIETALKLTRQYFLETGQPSRSKFIARWQSYHGNTLGALAAGGNKWRREPFSPLLVEMSHIAPCYAYRDQAEGESEEAYGLRVANELEAEILKLGPENVAGFLAEPVVGATMACVPGVAGYFKRIREICDQYGVLLILDEVMCGMGRTGTLFACEQDAIVPDIVTIAKGLGAGYMPIGATLCTAEIYDAIADGTGFFQHGFTYIGHPTACAAGLAVVTKIVEENLPDRVMDMGSKLEAALLERFGNHAHIGDIRGRGLFRGLELVVDRATKEPFDPALKLNADIKKRAMAGGLMCYPGGGTLDGKRGDHILLAPPFIVSEDQIGEIVEKLGIAVDGALGAAGF